MSSDVSYGDARDLAQSTFENGSFFEEGMKAVMTDFWMGEMDADEEDRKRVEVQVEEEREEFVPKVDRSGKWDSSYSVLCDELATYEQGGSMESGGEIDELEDELANATDELANQKRSDKDPNSPFILSLERKIKDIEEELSYHYEDYAKGGSMASGGSIKGRNNKSGESFGVVIGSKEFTDDDKDRISLNVRSSYSSRISETKLVFDTKGNLIETLDYGYTLDGSNPDKSGGSGRNIDASNKKETINAMVDLGYNKGFADKVIEFVKE